MGWLQLVGSMKLQVSFAAYRLFYRALLQKRPIISSILLTKATPYSFSKDNSVDIILKSQPYSSQKSTLQTLDSSFSKVNSVDIVNVFLKSRLYRHHSQDSTLLILKIQLYRHRDNLNSQLYKKHDYSFSKDNI